MAVSEARKRANNKYTKANYETVTFRVRIGTRDIIKAHADKYDEGSVNRFITRAVEETMQRDNENKKPQQ